MAEDDKARQQQARWAAHRAVIYLGDALEALSEADRVSGNHEFMAMANRVGTLLGHVQNLAEKA